MELKALLLYKSGELTPEGDPVICDFVTGNKIEPHPRNAERKSVVSMGGGKEFTVIGRWTDIATRAGYGGLLSKAAQKAAKIATKGTVVEQPPAADKGMELPGEPPGNRPLDDL